MGIQLGIGGALRLYLEAYKHMIYPQTLFRSIYSASYPKTHLERRFISGKACSTKHLTTRHPPTSPPLHLVTQKHFQSVLETRKSYGIMRWRFVFSRAWNISRPIRPVINIPAETRRMLPPNYHTSTIYRPPRHIKPTLILPQNPHTLTTTPLLRNNPQCSSNSTHSSSSSPY